MGWFARVSWHAWCLASLIWGWRAQPRHLEGRPSLHWLGADPGQGTAAPRGTPDHHAAVELCGHRWRWSGCLEHPTARRGPHPTAGQGGMAAAAMTRSAVSWHRPAPAGHPLRGGPRQRAGPWHEGVSSAGGARFPARCLAAPCPGLPRLPALHPLRPLP